MTCPDCGSEKFHTTRVYRNRIHKSGWVYSADKDSRVAICAECGGRFLTETKIVKRIIYKSFKLLIQSLDTNEQSDFDFYDKRPAKDSRPGKEAKDREKSEKQI